MNDHTIALVRESFDLIEPIAPQAGAMFCADLAEAEPSLQPLFKVDGATSGAKLMQVAERVVGQLDQPESLAPLIDDLGRRCAGLGLTEGHFEAARTALLRTLYQCLGVAYNAEVEEAWVDVYGEIVGRVRQAATVPIPA